MVGGPKNRTTDFSTLGYNERRIMVELLRMRETELIGDLNRAAADRDVVLGLIEDIGEYEEDK